MYYNLGEFENGLHKKVNDIVSTVDRHSLPSGMVDDVNESPVHGRTAHSFLPLPPSF